MQCIDTDGHNTKTTGSVEYVDHCTGRRSNKRTDFCIGDTQAIEHYCQGLNAKQKTENCPHGCNRQTGSCFASAPTLSFTLKEKFYDRPIPNAQVKGCKGGSVGSDSNGKVTLRGQRGDQDCHVTITSKFGTKTVTAARILQESNPTIHFTGPGATVSISGEMEGAKVKIRGVKKIQGSIGFFRSMRGKIYLERLGLGSYIFEFTGEQQDAKMALYPTSTETVSFTLDTPYKNKDIVVQFKPRRKLNVDVTDATYDHPIPGAKITLKEKTFTTNGQGRFSTKLEPGTYTATISKPGYKTKTENINLDKNVRLRTKLELDGPVTPPTMVDVTLIPKPRVSPITATLLKIDPPLPAYGTVRTLRYLDGTYQSLNIPKGTYSITFENGGIETAIRQETVSEGATIAIPVKIVKSVQLFVREGQDRSKLSTPAEATAILEYPNGTKETYTVINGLVRVKRPLPDGMYKFTAETRKFEPATKDVRISSADRSYNRKDYTVELTVPKIPTTLSTRVTYKRYKEPVPDAVLILENSDGSETHTLTEGEVEVAPGTYKARISGSTFKKATKSIRIKKSEITKLDMEVTATVGSLELKVTDKKTNSPIQHAKAYLLSGDTVVKQGNIKPNGIQFDYVPAGNYKARIEASLTETTDTFKVKAKQNNLVEYEFKAHHNQRTKDTIDNLKAAIPAKIRAIEDSVKNTKTMSMKPEVLQAYITRANKESAAWGALAQSLEAADDDITPEQLNSLVAENTKLAESTKHVIFTEKLTEQVYTKINKPLGVVIAKLDAAVAKAENAVIGLEISRLNKDLKNIKKQIDVLRNHRKKLFNKAAQGDIDGVIKNFKEFKKDLQQNPIGEIVKDIKKLYSDIRAEITTQANTH